MGAISAASGTTSWLHLLAVACMTYRQQSVAVECLSQIVANFVLSLLRGLVNHALQHVLLCEATCALCSTYANDASAGTIAH